MYIYKFGKFNIKSTLMYTITTIVTQYQQIGTVLNCI